MPTLYRSGLERYRKWEKKFDPATISSRFTQVADVAKERAQLGLVEWATGQDLVRPILDKYGVTATDRAKYIGFANKLLSHALRHSGEAAKAFADGLKSYYVTAMKADPTILDEIIQVITGWVVPY